MTGDLQTMLGDCVSVPEVANALEVEPWQVYELVQSERLPAVKAGRNWLIRRDDAVDYLSERAIEMRKRAEKYEVAIGRLVA